MNETPEPKRKRRWTSFSLRTLLFAITALAVWLAWWIPATRQQKEVADWIRSFNRTPDYLYRLDATGSPILNPESPIPVWLEDRIGVDFFLSIKRVHLDNRSLKDVGLLSRLHDLQHCEMADCELTDITPVAGLGKLEILSISKNPITDISPVSRLKKLRVFAAMDTEVTDLSALKELKNLESVYLRNAQVCDLSPLANHPSLSSLDVAQTNVRNIEPLKSIKTLATLNLSGTEVSEEDIAALQEVLPNCKITR